ncbi:MAG: carboxypeptidase regulatory-like domain-containing protein [Phycisphaerae bacterium]|nr:carboxypeptidase regulatory-like domain-containing protein [Phycisphaerae bacterium]
MRRGRVFAALHLAIALAVLWAAQSGCANREPVGQATPVDGNQRLDIAPGEGQPLAGVIVDENDVPVSDASVSILFQHVERQTTRTDSAGRFQFKDLPEGTRAELMVRKPGRATIHTTVRILCDAGEDAEVLFLLPVEAKIEGIVVEKGTGRPVAGVKLAVTCGKNRPAETCEPVTSHVDGTFSLLGLDAGRHTLCLASIGEGPADWAAAPIAVTLGVGEAATGLRVEVGKGGLLEIAVTETGSGQPIAKARVGAVLRAKARVGAVLRASEAWFMAASDANGVARIRLLPGTYEVSGVSCEGYSPQDLGQAVMVEDGTIAQVAVTFQSNVRGVVRDPQGEPVAGAQVKIMAGGKAEVTSDGRGRFEVAWARGGQPRPVPVFCLVARHEQRNLAAIVKIGRNVNSLDVKLAPCAVLTGRVVDPNGRGIGHAWVYVTLDVPDWGDTPLREEHLQSDDNGRFEIPALAIGGRYAIHAYADAYGSKAVVVEVGDAASRVLDIGALTLPAANLSLSGRVIDMRSRPVAYATIYGCGRGQPIRLTARTDAEGKFVLAGVCEGRIDLGVDPYRGGRRLWAEVSAHRGAASVEVVAR